MQKIILTLLLATFASALLLVPLIRRWAIRCRVVDEPNEPRKIHARAIPLLGGLAPFFVFVGGLALAVVAGLVTDLPTKHLFGLVIGGALLMIGGALDDKFHLAPSKQIIWPVLAALVIVASGIGIRGLHNPFGGTISLAQFDWIIVWIGEWPYRITLWADLFTFIWLMGMMYTTKFLDGLDGLTSGITVIGALIIALVSILPPLHQTGLALVAALGAGAFAGFLFWNWHPARIFLGEGGSLFAGFLLGTLAILSVSKVAVTLLVIGIPILDVVWVISRRVFWEKRAPWRGDDKHLHFRLLRVGLSPRQAVSLLLLISIAFGAIGLLASGLGKLIALIILLLLLVGCGILITKGTNSQESKLF